MVATRCHSGPAAIPARRGGALVCDKTLHGGGRCDSAHTRLQPYLVVALVGGQIMRRPTFNDTRRQPAVAASREALNGKECGEHGSAIREKPSRIPLPMMLIIGALMGASSD